MLGSIYHTVIAMSLFISLISVFAAKKEDRASHVLITVILGWVLLFESFGLKTARQGINNSLLYNISWVYIESLLLVGYFYLLEKSPHFRKRITVVRLK